MLRAAIAGLCVVAAWCSVDAATPGTDIEAVRLATPVADTSQSALRLFVEMQAPSLAAWHALHSEREGRRPDRAAQRSYAARLSALQLALQPALEPLVKRIEGRQRVALNGFRVVAPPAHIDALRSLPGVRSVRTLRLHEPMLSGSVPWIGVPGVWADGRGDGVRIAIIDTGIDYTHASFGGSGDAADFARNDPLTIEPATFPTARVEAGFDFAGPDYDARDPDSVPQPDPDPLDIHGHGTHVAAIAAGAEVGAHLGAGVAPEATLLALKVFSDRGGSTDLVPAAIEMALDPDGDGAIDDRVDVINMSLGSAFGDPDDPSARAAENAVAAGVIVVASAGNRADVPYVTGSPAVAPGVISVAASWPGNRTHPALAVFGSGGASGLHEAREALGPVSIAARPARAPLVRVRSPASNPNGAPSPSVTDNLACHPLANAAAVAGAIAVAARGGCEYLEKFLHAQHAGAIALVVYNDGTSSSRLQPQTMTGLDDRVAIPGVMLGHATGTALDAALAGGHRPIGALDASLRVAADSERDDTLAWFTSRGPGHGDSTFKPDLAAPGYGIVSAAAGTGFDARSLNGTSMAAPHVAGAAALARERFPALSPAAIRAMLQVTATDANADGPGTVSPYPLTRQGTGIVRIAEAFATPTLAQPAGLSFGRIEALRVRTEVVETELWNRGKLTRHYGVRHRPNQTVAGVSVDCPAAFSLDPGQRRKVSLALTADPAAMPYDRGFESQTEVDGWCIFDDGDRHIRVGYLAVVDAPSSLRASRSADGYRLTNDGPARGSAQRFVLAGATPLGADHDAAVAALGVRPRDYGGFPLIEFALVLRHAWESPSQNEFRIYIDNDEDGRDDFLLRIADWSAFGGNSGSLVTVQYPLDENGEPDLEAGFLDWIFNSVDYNDQVAIAPFTLIAASGEAFLQPGDTSFAWRLIATARDGSDSMLSGSVDFSAAPATVPVVVDPDDSVPVAAPKTTELWLYTANAAGRQFQTVAPGASTAH